MSSTATNSSPDGHDVTVTVPEGATEWQATASCAACEWTGEGWSVVLEQLGLNHENATDGSR